MRVQCRVVCWGERGLEASGTARGSFCSGQPVRVIDGPPRDPGQLPLRGRAGLESAG